VARRIEALEAALGLELFDKRRTGYAPTKAAKTLQEVAAKAESALHSVDLMAGQMRRDLTGTVRLTASSMMADLFLSPALKSFHARHPGLKLEVVSEDRHVDLARGEADIALRVFTKSMDQPGLVGRRIAPDRWSVYCSRDYAAAHGMPKNGAELSRHVLIMAEPGRYRVPIAEWIYSQVTPAEVAQFRNHVGGMFADIKAGHGVSVMSDLMAACDPDFVRCFTPDIEQPHEVWLLTHERLRDVPRVRAVMDFLVGFLAAHPAVKRVMGEQPAAPRKARAKAAPA
jgi:DNA-binding transcriptional LysR family regulator